MNKEAETFELSPNEEFKNLIENNGFDVLGEGIDVLKEGVTMMKEEIEKIIEEKKREIGKKSKYKVKTSVEVIDMDKFNKINKSTKNNKKKISRIIKDMEEIRINKDGCNSKKERCNCESCNEKFNSTRLFKMFYEEFDIDSFLNKITGKDYYYDLTDSYHYLLSSGDFEKMKNLIEHIMNDREDELYIFMSDYFRKSKNKEKERHYLIKFIQTQQEGVIDFRYMRAVLELGVSYLNSKILNKAGEYLTKLCSMISMKKTESKDNMYKIFAKNGYYYYGLYLEKIDLSDNIEYYFRLSSEEGNPLAMRKLIPYLEKNDKKEELMVYYEKLINMNDTTFLLDYAKLCKKLKQNQKALEILKKGFDKNILECCEMIGDYCVKKKLYLKAIEWYKSEAMMRIDTNYTKGYDSKTDKEITRINKKIGKYYLLKSYEDKKLKKKYLNETKQIFDLCIERNDLSVLFDMVILLIEEEDYENCELYCKFGEEKNYEKYKLLWGLLYFSQGKYEEMTNILQEGINGKETFEESISDCDCLLGYYYEKQNNYDKMKKYYEMSSKNNVFSLLRLNFYENSQKFNCSK